MWPLTSDRETNLGHPCLRPKCVWNVRIIKQRAILIYWLYNRWSTFQPTIANPQIDNFFSQNRKLEVTSFLHVIIYVV